MSKQETIEKAAISSKEGAVYTLPRPNRHPQLFEHYDELRTVSAGGLLLTRAGQKQGFVTSTGRFVDRREAGKIALAAGQVKRLDHPPELFTEDLW